MDKSNIIECGGFYFIHNFDSGNLGHVERVPTELIAPSIVNTKTNATETPEYEFNLWTRPDCAGTEFENGNRTWFYFGVQASEPNILVRLNLINLNKQGKMYNQGMAPVTRTLPGKPQWERIRDRPVHSTDDNTFTLSFKYRTSDNVKATTFFAFTYPFSFAELQIALNSIDLKMLPLPPPQSADDIYYCRECLIYSLEGRRVDLLTITSHHGITQDREERLQNLFPDNNDRPFKFANKKIIFISARVHPGETPSSFVFNGFLNLILNRHDPIAIQLRRIYVFKMIPFLNPDGVARGHYRTDTRGVNLNRVYLNPSLTYHPTVYASRALIRYYHFGCEKEDLFDDKSYYSSNLIIDESEELLENKKKTVKEPVKASDKKTTKVGAVKVGKQPADGKKEIKGMSADAANLAEQVYDMSLREMPSQTSDNSSKSSDNLEAPPPILNESTLRTCLGSTVHLSTSEELNFQGTNPLRPLRDALKNSISLLMESSSSVAGDSVSPKDSRLNNVKMGWCQECRNAAKRLGEVMTQPTTRDVESGKTYESIDEYREEQQRQLSRESQYAAEADAVVAALAKAEEGQPTASGIYFCTNCFKRYRIAGNDAHEEIIKPAECLSTEIISECLSLGDVQAEQPNAVTARKAQHTGDNVQHPASAKESRVRPSTGPITKKKKAPAPPPPPRAPPKEDSNLYLYIDLHGHASKKGIFMYGNHFNDLESSVECMLLPRIMSLNNLHFHFSSCNFTERNMYLKDRRDGMSREGSGRVAVLKATGLVRSYTLECNYNTGRLVNVLPPPVKDSPLALSNTSAAPPKYTPHIYEEEKKRVPNYRGTNLEVFEESDPYEVGRSLGASILDLTGQHPNSRIPCSEHRTLTSLREWLRAHTKTSRPQLTMARLGGKNASPSRTPLYARSKPKVTEERKENTYVGAKTDTERKRNPTVLNQRSQQEIITMNMKYVKKEPVKTSSRTKYLGETEPKPKTMTSKKRSVLGIRKPNTSKTQVGGTVKAKVGRRSADDTETPRPVQAKLSKRNFFRTPRGGNKANRCRAMASSSSDDLLGGWEDVQGGTILGSQSGISRAESLTLASKRRTFNAQAPSHLKKIRLKSVL